MANLKALIIICTAVLILACGTTAPQNTQISTPKENAWVVELSLKSIHTKFWARDGVEFPQVLTFNGLKGKLNLRSDTPQKCTLVRTDQGQYGLQGCKDNRDFMEFVIVADEGIQVAVYE